MLVLSFSFSAFAQDSAATLDAAMATADPVARIEALQKLLQAQPDSPQAETIRAELTRAFAYLGEAKLTEKNIDGAIQNFKRAVAAFPQKVDDQFFDEVAIKIPLAVSARGYRTEAILLAREIEAHFVGEAKRLTSLGEFYLSVEAPSEALRALTTATKLAPDNARIHRTLGTAYRVNLNLAEAAAQYQHAIKADPKDGRAYFELGNLQRARGNYELAVNLYNHQLSLEPDHVPSLKGLALCFIAQGKENQAADLLAQAVKAANAEVKQDFYFQTQLAMTYLARGKVGKARLATDAALGIEPRFSWARIAAAEADLAEGKYFEAERNVIAAMKYADFPTLHFLLGKVYLAVEDFEGALAEFNKAFSYKGEKFQTRLGGAVEMKAATIAELLAPERQASLFQAEPITNDVEFKLAENLVRFEDALHGARQSSSALLSSILINQKANKNATASLQKATEEFVETEGSRKPFRWLYAAERLTQAGQALETALLLTTQALDAAESVTTPDGSLRDYPNYDREGRLHVFRGRTLTLRGRALIKLGRTKEAITTLEQAVETYGFIPERKSAQWQLALAKETAGQTKEALDLYIAAYEPPDKASLGSDLNRAVIESLYRKVNGSLDGLNERIGKSHETSQLASSVTKPLTPLPTTETAAPTEKAGAPPAETSAPPATANVEIPKQETTAVKTTPESTILAEVAPESKAEKALALPEARVLALVVGEIAKAEGAQEFVLENGEDAVPPMAAVAVKSESPTENANALTALSLPESKPIALAIAPEPLIPSELKQEFDLTADDAPLPTANLAVETAKVAAETAALTVPTPIALPAVTVLPTTVLPTLEDTSNPVPEFALSRSETDDPAPYVVAIVKPETEAPVTPTPLRKGKSVPTKTQLSDSRVAEIEKAIEGRSGKKGDKADAVEESASGHIEGDAPVRISQPIEPILPSGESGHISGTLPKANNTSHEDGSKVLPGDVEQRAKTIGQSAGKLSVGAAMEIEAPEKPAGGGRKGITNTTDQEGNSPNNTRPRRVEDKPKDKKKPSN